ncbi:hypothetical protein SSABA_v1c00270 [Spiroplasma sabaudiense Ar-1343]|uniref:Lipoprotein n=1 Tax=Spiroplasma sabaudiense Ar-1343 TaxID=1276257 RepID=W6AIA6_9MOLU|nr:lipoprotein [Spiroplasma sabaudiense]AHI53439.1 hypothetical protein SSABA_v1c00270 [Spiroplasma sabaudiense Ar-1343]
MKKLLAILGAFSLAVSTTMSVVSCAIPQSTITINVGSNGDKDTLKSFNGGLMALNVLASEIMNVLNFKKEMYPDVKKYEEQKKLRTTKENKLYSFEELINSNSEIITGKDAEEFKDEYQQPYNSSFTDVHFEPTTGVEAFQSIDLAMMQIRNPEKDLDGASPKFIRLKEAKDKESLPNFDKFEPYKAKILRSEDLTEGIKISNDKLTTIPEKSTLTKKVGLDENGKIDFDLKDISQETDLAPYIREVEVKGKDGNIKQNIVTPEVSLSFKVDDFIFQTYFVSNEKKFKISMTISGLRGILSLMAASPTQADVENEKIDKNYFWFLRRYQFNNEKVTSTGSLETMQGTFDDLKIDQINIEKI